ncbi:Card1-like endonuclease domain-containing protein [Lyngbya sp. CCY1209]|uniref:Card1-like endonuclease domain-containing protein n=1 Tax=Lyngbya sp. CCY1209 TaxID=2886103 RepID=UPI002D20EB97|nr:hypothetical protein [Lyngbya sp. CCY1209]MEB3885147.1 hypothetical protein [Lyngbya sp. CCY1209]
MTSILSTFDLAKQGDVNAIGSLIRQKLRSKKIVTKFTFNGGELNFYVESEIFSAQTVGAAIFKYIDNCRFNVKSIQFIKIYKPREGRWQLAHRVPLHNPDKLIVLNPLESRQNSSDLFPAKAPSQINPNSEIDTLRGELKQLKRSLETEVKRLSKISSQLEDALHDHTKDDQNLKAIMFQIIDLLIQYPPAHPPGEHRDCNDENGRDNTVNNGGFIEKYKIPEIPESTQLRQYLEQLNIKVLSSREPNPSDTPMNKMAVKLGKNYPNLARLHQAIVRSIPHNQAFDLNLANSSQLEISNSTQSGHNLYNLSFLSEYHYDRKKRKITGKVDRKSEILNFFNGIWFEQFIYAEIDELFDRNNIDYECLINPQLEFANGDKFELDFLFLVNDKVLWIECKSGRNNNNLSYNRYENHKQVMQLPKERSLLVLLQASKEQTEELTQMRDLTIANTDNLIEKVKRGLNWEIDA